MNAFEGLIILPTTHRVSPSPGVLMHLLHVNLHVNKAKSEGYSDEVTGRTNQTPTGN